MSADQETKRYTAETGNGHTEYYTSNDVLNEDQNGNLSCVDINSTLPQVDADATDGQTPQGFVAIPPTCASQIRMFFNNDYHTSRGKRLQMVKLITVSCIPMLALVIQNIVLIVSNLRNLETKVLVRGDIQFSLQTGTVVHYLQIERGTTALYVSSGGDSNVYVGLKRKYYNTDMSIQNLPRWPMLTQPPHFRSKSSFHEHIKQYRRILNPMNSTILDVIRFYKYNSAIIIKWVTNSIQNETGDIWRTLVGYHMLILSKEEAGIERALGSTFYARGGFPKLDHIWYLEKRFKGVSYLERCVDYSPRVKNFLLRVYSNTTLEHTLATMRKEIELNNNTSPSVQMGTWWFDNMTLYINMLKTIQDDIALDVVQKLETEISNLQNNLIVSIVIMTLISICLLPTVVFWVHRLTGRMQIFASNLQDKTKELIKERRRTQTLLYEMLPVSVAKRMLNNQTVPPEAYDSVTVFFSDVVGFTRISSSSTPLQVVAMLNVLYESFDQRLEIYDAYKVETIGDAYMVASGLPQRNGSRHSWEIASLALDLVTAIPNIAIPHMPDETFKLRIGVNTGPVVAGVVGYKMPRYCLFGDTVNTASRMESTGQPLKIQITYNTEQHLKLHGCFRTEARGEINIKGKGSMLTFWLLGKDDLHNSEISVLDKSMSNITLQGSCVDELGNGT